LGVLPTPIGQLYEVAQIEEVELDRSAGASIWRRFSAAAKELIKSALDQVRGAADLRRRVVFIQQSGWQPRILFARAHELGHQAMPWHRMNPDYLDDDHTMGSRIKAVFEREANLFAAETIFQGQRFKEIAGGYRPAFSSIFELAYNHGASRHATFWRFVEDHCDALAGLTYWPNERMVARFGVAPGLSLDINVLHSLSFTKKIGVVTFPGWLERSHPWAQAWVTGEVAEGETPIMVSGLPSLFLWEAYWNGFCLLVLVRRRPLLRIVGRVLHGK
jgi:hypothetical protein